jgi:hypothetical protein
MVLLSQLAGLASFGYAGWQIAGKWFQFRSKNETLMDDAQLFTALQDAIAKAKAEAKREEKFGASAARSGHAHLFEDFDRLPLHMRVQFIEDLTKVATWSGQASKVIGAHGQCAAWMERHAHGETAFVAAVIPSLT